MAALPYFYLVGLTIPLRQAGKGYDTFPAIL